jgi:hypothetical protein
MPGLQPSEVCSALYPGRWPGLVYCAPLALPGIATSTLLGVVPLALPGIANSTLLGVVPSALCGIEHWTLSGVEPLALSRLISPTGRPLFAPFTR